MPRRSAADAAATRTAILDRAVHVASLEGLEGLTIGRLAGDLGMSKAGLIGGFGSKERLQLAALDTALDVFRREVWEPAAGEEPGLPRLRALVAAWISYHEREVFPGGCFLTAATAEFDGRPGAVRDRIDQTWKLWRATLRHDAEVAGLPDPDQFVFELEGTILALNLRMQMGDRGALSAARRTAARLLR